MGKAELKQLLNNSSSTYQHLISQYMHSAEIWMVISVIVLLGAAMILVASYRKARADDLKAGHLHGASDSRWWELVFITGIIVAITFVTTLVNFSHLISPDVSMLSQLFGRN